MAEFIKKRKQLSQLQFIALGFLIMIVVGSILLMLPVSSRNGTVTNFLSALFTATSAICVTGLVVVDTASHWSTFGQIIIIILIQIGGLGFISIGVFFSIILRRKIGLRERGLIKESINATDLAGVVKIIKKVIFGTFFIEVLGAIALLPGFISRFGILRGIYFSFFHSISAFCNAGFDLMGRDYGEYASLSGFYSDAPVNIIIMLLILTGGIGFIVWDDISRQKLRFKKYKLHTKIVLLMSAILIFGGAGLFFVSERNTLLADLSTKDKILASLFMAVSPRTAGFNTLDLSKLSNAGKLITTILMYIGGGSGSTAGGIKMTSMFVIILSIKSNITKEVGMNIFGRRIEDGALATATAIAGINLSLIIISSTILFMLQNLPFADVLFETTSAISTVGMTTGITRDFVPVSKLVLIIMMYLGRVGSLSFALSFTQNKKITKIMEPKESISVG